jgi:hypothetical protein
MAGKWGKGKWKQIFQPFQNICLCSTMALALNITSQSGGMTNLL